MELSVILCPFGLFQTTFYTWLLGTAIFELKITQELDSVNHDTLFLVFLDLQKVYDTVDWGHLMTTL